MRQITRLLVPTVAASLLLAACGSSSSSSSSAPAASAPAAATSSSSSPSVVKTASNAALHSTVLVDAKGMTLYRLAGESATKWICTSAECVKFWPPVTASAGGAPKGSVALGTAKRPDGTMQITYKGMPLYTFAGDKKPGDAKGQGIKVPALWTAVTTGGSSAPAAIPAASSSTSSASGGGYGY
jgi:predicted lipoprotein with Yx(FWY)xxD motif